VFLFITAVILEIVGIRNEIFWIYYRNIVLVLAWSGSIIGIFGSIKLFISRISDKNLSLYSTPSHYFNIFFIGGIYLTILVWLIRDRFIFGHLFSYYYSLLNIFNSNDTTLIARQMLSKLPLIGYIHIILSLLFMVYLPFTHMTHFFTKFFTYHKVRWDDEANKPGSKMAEKMAQQLDQTVTWAAPHIGADGRKNWIAIATSAPSSKEHKDA
jgi:nitrate reductase gamma subunit